MANAVIGSLRVDLGLNSASFFNGLGKAQKGLTGFQKSMSAISSSLKATFAGFATGAASALTLGAAINGTRAALDAFGNIADRAAQAGIGTDLFQGLTSMAAQSGVAIEEVSSALNTFAKNSGLAAVGKGKLVATLQKLNPELLRNLQLTSDQEERMRLAADAIAKAGSASERAALSTALFGDAGAKMAVVFQGGAQAIDAWMNKARDMGLIVDRDIIAKADEMGDSFDTAAKILDTQMKQALINIAPLLIDAARFASDVAKAINSVVDATRELGAKSRAGLERERADLMQLLGDATSLGDMNANPMAVGLPPDQIAEMQKQLAAIDAELRARAMDDLRVRLSELPKQVEDTAGSIGSKVNTEPLDLGISKTTAALEKMNNVGKTLGETMANSFSNFADAVLSGVSPLQALADELGNIGKQLLNSSLQSLFSNLFGGGFGSFAGNVFGGGWGGNNALAGASLLNAGSFAGGGYTGPGTRAGGVDGMGGFPAILHPNETVIDHTMGQSAGGNSRVLVQLDQGLIGQILQQAHADAVQVVKGQSAAAVATAQRNKWLG